jgi:hypothetical protein
MAPVVRIQIRRVPAETHAVLVRRAAAAEQSLQEHLRSRLIAEAQGPTLEEVLDRGGRRTGGALPLAAAAEAVRQDRAVVDANALAPALVDDADDDGDAARAPEGLAAPPGAAPQP